MKISFLGGACEVGASSILVKIDNKNILLDSGIRQNASKDPLPDFRAIQEMGGLDSIVISHAHLDHIGSLPIICKEYPLVRIYMNNMTKDLLRVLLYDSIKIMNSRETEIPFYAEQDVEAVLNRIFTINYEAEYEILENIRLTLYNAGHIAGASCVYLKSKEGALFYSGDFSIFSQNTVDGAKIPKLRPDVAIFEATYGDKLHSNRQIEESKLIDLVSECVNRDGKMLIPAFALGRAQEILLILKKAINKGMLKSANIYVDGMVKNINAVYRYNPLYLRSNLGKKILKGLEPFYDDNIKEVSNKEEREKILEKKENAIIISSSGMLTGGPSQYYAEKIAGMDNGYIAITGYQDEESPGRKLLNLAENDGEDKVLEVNGKSVPVKCQVGRIGLSAHGDKSEIKALIEILSPKNVFLVHGEEAVIKSLANELMKDSYRKIYTPKSGNEFEIQIANPRKQLKKQLPFTMKKEEELDEINVNMLWEYINQNYEGRLFTTEDLIYIWKGEIDNGFDNILQFQRVIIDSPYFESDIRRLFLFKLRKKEEIEEFLKPKELKPNEINEVLIKIFGSYEYKKAGLKLEEKKVILYFDFPRSVNLSIYDKFKLFEEETGWKIELYQQVNNNAAENVIRELMVNEKIKKISFNQQLNKVTVILDCQGEFQNIKEKFKGITGLELEFQEYGNKGSNFDMDTNLFKANGIQKIEQNDALKYIDEQFEKEEFKPYKKSIKADNEDKYIELVFVSPFIGRKYEEKIKGIVTKIGWTMNIANSYNQNEIINLALRLCSKEEVVLKKNPSFNPNSGEVIIKAEEISEEIFIKIKKEFDYQTGCSLCK